MDPSNLVRDALELLIALSVGAILWTSIKRLRAGKIQAYRCIDCERPMSRVYEKCPRCGATQSVST